MARRTSYERLQSSPLRLTGALEGTLYVRCRTWETLPARLEPYATVFLATRAHEAAPLVEALKPKLAKSATVVLCQSGIGLWKAANALLPKVRVMRLAAYVTAERWELDHVHVSELSRLELAGEPGDEVELDRWRGHLARPELKVTRSLQPAALEWREALLPIAVHAAACLADAPSREMLESSELHAVASLLLDEAIAVGNLAGAGLSPQDKAAVFQRLQNAACGNPTLLDLRHGRAHELPYWNGAVVAAALEHRSRAPLNELVLHLVGHLEKAEHWKKKSAADNAPA